MISLLRAELCRSDPPFPGLSDTDWQEAAVLEPLIRLSAAHDLTHIIGAALYRMDIPRDNPYAQVLKKAQINAAIRYEQLQYELMQITGLFEEAHIRHIPLKGAVLRSYYPKPEMRTSCDIDLLIEPEALETASSVLTERLEYSRQKEGSHDVSFLSPCGVHLELHFTLLEDKSDPRIQQVLSRVWTYAKQQPERSYAFQLQPEFFYFYHIAHMVKHFLYGGCDIRPFMDLWVMRHRWTAVDRDVLDALLEEGGIRTFAGQMQNLSEVWFSGINPTPDSLGLIRSMEEYLLYGGLYGSTENRVKVGRMENKGKLSYICSRLFLPYDQMKYDYPILQKHRALLPFCEVHRWSRLLSGNTVRRITGELKINEAVTEDDRLGLQEMFQTLGLQ